MGISIWERPNHRPNQLLDLLQRPRRHRPQHQLQHQLQHQPQHPRQALWGRNHPKQQAKLFFWALSLFLVHSSFSNLIFVITRVFTHQKYQKCYQLTNTLLDISQTPPPKICNKHTLLTHHPFLQMSHYCLENFGGKWLSKFCHYNTYLSDYMSKNHDRNGFKNLMMSTFRERKIEDDPFSSSTILWRTRGEMGI